jgi:hypothetical protein
LVRPSGSTNQALRHSGTQNIVNHRPVNCVGLCCRVEDVGPKGAVNPSELLFALSAYEHLNLRLLINWNVGEAFNALECWNEAEESRVCRHFLQDEMLDAPRLIV